MKSIRGTLSRRNILKLGAALAPILGGLRIGSPVRALAPGILPAIAFEMGFGAWFPSEIGSGSGFYVVDYHVGPKFWTAYQALGGNSVLGNPLSRA